MPALHLKNEVVSKSGLAKIRSLARLVNLSKQKPGSGYYPVGFVSIRGYHCGIDASGEWHAVNIWHQCTPACTPYRLCHVQHPGRTVQSLHFELLRAKFRVYFEFRNTEISCSHAILLRPNSAAQLLIFFVVSRHFGTVLRFKTK